MKHIFKISTAALAAAMLAASCQKEVPMPTVSLEETYTTVAGEAIKITPVYENCDGATYNWTIDGESAGQEATFTHTFAEAGTFTVTVDVETQGGKAQASTTVEVSNKIATLTFEGEYWNALIDTPQYGGPLLYGDGTTSVDYHWYDEGNTFLASEPCSGINWTTFEEGYVSFMNGGHAISNYINTDLEACNNNYQEQLSIPLEGGHSGSNFCIHNGYISSFSTVTGYFYFKDGTGRTIDHMYITNTSYYLGTVNAVATDTDWTKVIATGTDAEGNVTGTSEFYLTQNGKSINEWTKWDLTSLGTPVKVEFNIESSIANDYGMTAPAYFAYDDVAVVL